jgi:hypothetical protein
VGADGKETEWMVEGGTPNTLLRAGIDRNSLKAGQEIIVRGYQSKDRLCRPACKANGRDVTFPTGASCSWARPARAPRRTARTRPRSRSGGIADYEEGSLTAPLFRAFLFRVPRERGTARRRASGGEGKPQAPSGSFGC